MQHDKVPCEGRVTMEYELLAQPTRYSERIVVDEILYEGNVRLLRAKYKGDLEKSGISIENWGREREQIVPKWRVEAFVGYPSEFTLQEGDVFFIRDGRRLTARYKPIKRETARRTHLLVDNKDSGKIARAYIKSEYKKLTITEQVDGEREREEIRILIDKVTRMPRPKRRKRNA